MSTSPPFPGAPFPFEDAARDPELLSFSARRALDAAGVKLSLSGYQKTSPDFRRSLSSLGAEPDVPAPSVRVLLAGLPGTSDCASFREGTEPTSRLCVELGEGEVQLLWPRLAGLARYTLEKIAASERVSEAVRRSRLVEAAHYFQKEGAVLTHLDAAGRARMVEVGHKEVTERVAVAEGRVHLGPRASAALREGAGRKGDVLAVARIAGIQAAKKTPELIPLCHTVQLTSVEVQFSLEGDSLLVTARARARDRTGIEMQALTAVSVSCLTVYDMLKAVDREMVLQELRVVGKAGGASGAFGRTEL